MFQRFQFWWIIWDYVQRQSFLALSIFKKLFFVWFCLFRSYLSDEEHCFSSFCCGRIWQTWENTALFFVVVFFTSKGILHWRELWGVPACITALIKTLWEHCQHIHLLWSQIYTNDAPTSGTKRHSKRQPLTTSANLIREINLSCTTQIVNFKDLEEELSPQIISRGLI